ncbi:MAG: hypothetical protein ABIP89_11410 [Polyangiaceae bacterium]
MKASRIACAVSDIVTALLIAVSVFVALPSRWWPVDVGAVLLIALLGAAGVGLLAKASWAEKVARSASIASLVMGFALVATLALTASYLRGIYGPVGRGGALILALVAALVIPYLLVFPSLQLLWLGALRPAASKEKSP